MPVCDSDACECEKRPANEHNNGGVQVGNGRYCNKRDSRVYESLQMRYKRCVGVNHACTGLDLPRHHAVIMIVVEVELGSWHKRSHKRRTVFNYLILLPGTKSW
jgi:hypothetical protein